MMKQFYDLKEKHPTAILLFRCGDFYETYEQDACICAKVLDITLTKAEDGTHMAGFPHHALDTYLPKLVRYCYQPESIMKRVAICDQLEPPKPTKKSAMSELINNLTTNNPNNNPQTTNTTMKLSINNQNNESANVVNNPAAQAVSAEPIRDAEAVEVTEPAAAAEPADKSAKGDKAVTLKRKAASKRGQSGAGSDSAEREQARPEARVAIKRKKSEPAAEQPATSQYSIAPYTNKQGETGYFLFGFTSQEEAKGLADRMAKSVREGFRYESHTRFDVVAFPPRYVEIAKQVCDALNKGDQAAMARLAAATFDIYSGVVTESKAKREAERKERKEAEAKAKAAQLAKVKKQNGLYSKEDVANLLADVLEGKDVPEDIKKLLAA